MKKKVLILSGGISKERLISLDTGLQVAKELKKNGYKVKISEPDKNLEINIKNFGVFKLFFIKIFLEISLSIAIDDEIGPEWVYGILKVSRIVWIYPSSPNCPCNALKMTAGLKISIFFNKLISGSEIFTL